MTRPTLFCSNFNKHQHVIVSSFKNLIKKKHFQFFQNFVVELFLKPCHIKKPLQSILNNFTKFHGDRMNNKEYTMDKQTYICIYKHKFIIFRLNKLFVDNFNNNENTGYGSYVKTVLNLKYRIMYILYT